MLGLKLAFTRQVHGNVEPTSSMKGVYPLFSLLANTSIFFSKGKSKNALPCSKT